jgi:hypothetical protein
MIESGIVTRPVELFETIQLNMDADTADTLASTLNHLFSTQLNKMFSSEQVTALEKLNDTLVVAVNKYHVEFTDNEYTGDVQC